MAQQGLCGGIVGNGCARGLNGCVLSRQFNFNWKNSGTFVTDSEASLISRALTVNPPWW